MNIIRRGRAERILAGMNTEAQKLLQETCDQACPAYAQYMVMTGAGPLLLCGHHYKQLAVVFTRKRYLVTTVAGSVTGAPVVDIHERVS